MPTISEITSFLSQVKAAINNNNYDILESRKKYRDTLAYLGIIKQDVLDDIKNLTVNENWSKEPDNNTCFPGDVWICTKRLHDEKMYIKLKIKISPPGQLLIMSSHIAEY